MWDKVVRFFKGEPADSEDDAKILSDMGYKQDLFRGVTGWFMNFAFTFTAVSIIPSYSISYGNALLLGGPVIMLWGWVVGSFFTILVGLSMAEICSTYPSAGSVYHWAGQLAKKENAPFASYICGWFNLLGNAAGDAAFASGFAGVVASAIGISYPDYSMDSGVTTAISIGVTFIWTLTNCLKINYQGLIMNFAAVFQVLSSLVIIIVVLAMAPAEIRPPASFVFTYYNDETGLSPETSGTQLYVTLIGLLSTLFAFSGYEAGGHIAEETQGARISAPRGIIGCVTIGAIVGLIYILGLLFATPTCGVLDPANVNATLSNCTSSIVDIYQEAGGEAGGLGLTILLVILLFFAGTSSITVTTRIGFAMARDGALPFKEYLCYINQTTMNPLGMVWFVFVIDCLILLLQLAGTTAFAAILSITTIGFQISYAIPIFLRVTDARETFPQGAFNLGKYSLLIGWISALWLAVTSIFFFFPTSYPVNAQDMNYTIVLVGGVLVICLIFWFAVARFNFKGPKRPDHDPSNSQQLEEVKEIETKPPANQPESRPQELD